MNAIVAIAFAIESVAVERGTLNERSVKIIIRDYEQFFCIEGNFV
jgi:hypothetical protein